MLPASSQSSTGFQTLLRNRPFMTLWVGQLLSQLADKVFFVLLIALIVNYQAPTFQVGHLTWAMPPNSMRSALMIAATLPAIFFGSAAGIFVDRYDKKAILSGCNFWRGVMLLLLPLPFVPKEFVILLTIAFLESILTQFFAPAEQAAIPCLVKRENLLTANALFTTTMMGSMIVGFAIGDPLLNFATSWNATWGREIMVGSLYILASGFLYIVPLKQPHLDQEVVAVHPWSDFKAGLKYLKKDRLVSNAMVQLMILYSVLAALVVLAIELVKQLGMKETAFSYLMAAAGVGMVLGAGVLGHWGERLHHKHLPLIGFLSMSFVLAMFAVISAGNPDPNSIGVVLLLCGLLGIGGIMVGLPMQTLVQQQTPEAMRGKVFGFQNNVINIALSLPLAIAGPLTDAIGLQSVLVGISVSVSGIGVWAWHNTRKVMRQVL
jgi:MFS family permease